MMLDTTVTYTICDPGDAPAEFEPRLTQALYPLADPLRNGKAIHLNLDTCEGDPADFDRLAEYLRLAPAFFERLGVRVYTQYSDVFSFWIVPLAKAPGKNRTRSRPERSDTRHSAPPFEPQSPKLREVINDLLYTAKYCYNSREPARQLARALVNPSIRKHLSKVIARQLDERTEHVASPPPEAPTRPKAPGKSRAWSRRKRSRGRSSAPPHPTPAKGLSPSHALTPNLCQEIDVLLCEMAAAGFDPPVWWLWRKLASPQFRAEVLAGCDRQRDREQRGSRRHDARYNDPTKGVIAHA
ncbi:MAG: hypothetical protein KAV00_17295 [Phycisphaerae bacterium]|nr:hypothetical protein [Phycisphaerae bacterium]